MPTIMHDAMALIGSLDRDGRVGRALSGVVQATTPNGRPWCPPEVADQLITTIALRDKSLVAAMQGVVRLARLLEHTSDGGLIAALYGQNSSKGDLPQLSRGAFRRHIESAVVRGRLPSAAFAVEGNRVVCLEAELATETGGVRQPAVLPFAHMPLQGALLAVLNEALGFPAVVLHLDGVLGQGPPSSPAYAIANALLRDFDAWLTVNLNTAHHMRQVRTMRRFLSSQGRFHSTAIDDGIILEFWGTQAENGSEDGFRLFKEAARKMIALRDMISRIEIEHSEAIAGNLDVIGERGEHEATSSAAMGLVSDAEWQSPLAGLLAPPADRVRWLMRTEIAQLTNYLGRPGEATSATPEAAVDGELGDEAAGASGAPRGLSAGGRYDLSLWRTLLRADVFGAIQSSLVQHIRDGANPDEAMADLRSTSGDDPYMAQIARYQGIRTIVQDEILIVLDGLVRAANANALQLLAHAGSTAVVDMLSQQARATTLQAMDDANDRIDALADAEPQHASAVIISALHDAACRESKGGAGPLLDVMREAGRARSRVRRKGMEQPLDEAGVEAFAAAAGALAVLKSELDRLLGVLAKSPVKDMGKPDEFFFFNVFQRLFSDR